MSNNYPNLFKPIRIGNVTLKNRIISAPTGLMDLTPDGRLTRSNMSYYELKARGGAAVVTLGESITHTETGESHNRQIHLDDPNVLPSLTHTAMAIQHGGALANIELSHGGKYGGIKSIAGELKEDRIAYGPSSEDLPTGEHVHEMSVEMIYKLVDCYRDAAAMCKTAGFDMVMVHAAHGWLFNQFLSPVENRRTDEFGGSLENRARFLMLALDAVRDAVGPGFPIELRMNGDDFIEGAMTLTDYVELAKMVEHKVDLINVSCGSHEKDDLFVRTHPSMFHEYGCNVYLAAAIKEVVSVPVACVGGITTPELAEEIIATGKADIVEMARALIADPYFPKKAKAGLSEDITPCLRCFECLHHLVTDTVIRCTVNPVIGHEIDVKYFKPEPRTQKRILVVGGGPGGMQAAITAANNGHIVTLCEKDHYLGGVLNFAKNIPFKHPLFEFAQILERRVHTAGVKVVTGQEVDRSYVEAMKPDVLIIASGAKPTIPPITGIESENVFVATDYDKIIDRPGQKVVVIGGGLIGCELGVHLGMTGRDVTIVEMRDCLAPDSNSFHRMALMAELNKYTKSYVGTQVVEVTEDGVVCKNKEDEEILIHADTVVLAAGMTADTGLYEMLYDSAPEVYPIGDCTKVGQVLQAVQQGYFIVREI